MKFGRAARNSARKRTRRVGNGTPLIEFLERRALLSASAWPPGFAKSVGPAPSDQVYHFKHVILSNNGDLGFQGSVSPPTSAFNPTQIKHAYGIDLITDGGVLADGTGMTIAIIDAFDNPKFVSRSSNPNVNQDASFLASDLHKFDLQYGLPEPPGFFTKVNQNGGTTYPTGDTGWGTEIALDVEWVHAIAPGAKIILIEANSNTDANLVQAAGTWARDFSGAVAVSMSFGRNESSTNFDSLFHSPADHGLVWLASTGDTGTPGGYPAYSPNVVAVGGTTLTAPGGVYSSESGWSGSGGGISQFEAAPAYQQGLVIHNGSGTVNPNGKRTIPDISFDANSSSGVAVYDSFSQGSAAPWIQVGGTSFSAPAWAGLVAILDQIRANHGKPSFDGLTGLLPALYDAKFAGDYHDITTGSNGFSAGVGYDLVTGIGTPKADTLIPKLAGIDLAVASSTPAAGSIVFAAPTSFSIRFSDPIEPSSLQASDLTVNSIAANGVSLSADNTTATFTYATSPVTTDGLQSMAVVAGAVTKLGDALTGVKAFTSSFRYDSVLLQVASTSPPAGGVFTLPAPLTYDVTFNEPVNPTSVQTSDLAVSGITGASVSGVTVLPGNATARFTISGITKEGTLVASIAAGAITDAFGNPGGAFNGSYIVDFATSPLPVFGGVTLPAGSLIYSSTATGFVNPAGDQDNYTVTLDPNQLLSVSVSLNSTSQQLQPIVSVFDSSNNLVATSTASAAGKAAFLQTIPTSGPGPQIYTIRVEGAGSSFSTGNYLVETTLNAPLEQENLIGSPNDTAPTAESIDSSSIALGSTATRMAVKGGVAAFDPDYYSFNLSAGDIVTLGVTNLDSVGQTNGTLALELRDASDAVLATGVFGPTNLTYSISNFVVSATGTYYARITGIPGTPYDLLVARNAAFSTEPNDNLSTSQPLTRQSAALGYLIAGVGQDWYSLNAKAGNKIVLQTSTPSDAAGEFRNTLDPHLELYNSAGVLVASGTVLPDGRNESLIYQAPMGDLYRAVVRTQANTGGEYILTVSPLELDVTGVTPASGAVVPTPPTSFVVGFTEPIDPTTLDSVDMTVNSIPADSVVLSADGKTATFTYNTSPVTTEGLQSIALATGVVATADDPVTTLTAFSSTFRYDSLLLQVASTSPSPGGIFVLPAPFTLDVNFNEPLDPNSVQPADLVLSGIAGATVTGATVQPGNITARFTIGGITSEGTLSASIAAGTITDPFGNLGAAFSASYVVDVGTAAFPLPLVGKNPAGSLIYESTGSGIIGTAGDIDSFTIALDASQTATIIVTPTSGNLQPSVTLYDSGNATVGTASATAAGQPAVLQTAAINGAGGIYSISIGGAVGSMGNYSVRVILNAAAEEEGTIAGASNDTAASAQSLDSSFEALGGTAARGAVLGTISSSADVDFYALSLSAGESLTVALQGSSTNLTAQLRDAGGAVIASAINGPANLTRVLSDFVAPTTGTYYVAIAGASSTSYGLVLTKNAEFGIEGNDTLAAAQTVLSHASGSDQFVLGHVGAAGDAVDLYQVVLPSGVTLVAQTSTPSDGLGEFVNTLDPQLRILDAGSNQVAFDDNSSADGRNALTSFTNNGPAATFYVEVSKSAASSTQGEYILKVTGNSAAFPAFRVTTVNPSNASSLRVAPATVTLDFNSAILQTSVDTPDLQIDGMAAAGFVIVDNDTVTFNLPAGLPDGTHTLTIAAGAISDIHGVPLDVFSSSFSLDTTGPRVVATSIGAGQSVAPGTISYQVTFSEPMLTSNLSSDDFSLRGNLRGVNYSASSFAYNAAHTVLTLNYASLPDDNYTLTLVAGANVGANFTDVLGNALDGELAGSLPSGDGIPGGNFAIGFNLDLTSEAFPTTFTSKLPLGSMIYDPSLIRTVTFAGDSDAYTLTVDPGQTLTVVVTPSGTGLQPRVDVLDPSSNLIGSATAVAAGQKAILQTISTSSTATGVYQIVISGAGSTAGLYTLQVTLNAALEAEGLGGATNDTLQMAQNVDGSAVPLGGAATRLAVTGGLGTGPQSASENFESGTLPPTISTFSSNSFGRIRVMAPGGSGNSSAYALIMDSNTDGNLALNEAVLTVNLAGLTQATLTFSHINFSDEANSLPTSFTGHFNGDGVAISADGNTWYTIFNATSTDSVWTATTIDLAAAAATAGIAFGPNFKIKFQQYDDFGITTDGRGYDNIVVASPEPEDDYSLTLNAGDTATFGLKSLATGTVNLTLKNSAGATLAFAVAGPTNLDKVISDFVAPSSGTYYVAVFGTTGATYSLTVAKNAEFNAESNNTTTTAQPVLSQQVGGDQYVLGHVGATGDTVDMYQVNLAAGATLALQTFTPADAAGVFSNTFNPRLRVLSASGVQLALNDNSAPDGRNALLSYTNTGAAGKFLIEVSSTTTISTQGEYVLKINGNAVSLPAFNVTTINPANGTRLRVAPTTVTVDFNDVLLQSSVSASDLKIDGISATGFTIVDADTVRFTLPSGLAEGTHSLTIAAGDILDIQSTPVAAFSSNFLLDTIAPQIIGTSVLAGTVLLPGSLAYQITFSEPMLTSNLTSGDFALRGNLRVTNYSASTFSYDASGTVLTLNFGSLPDDNYTLTLTAGASGGTFFTDVTGNALDGEFTGAFPTGDGIAGGDFAIGFNMDLSSEPLPTMTVKPPAGSLIYSSSIQRVIAFAGDSDTFTASIDPHQTVNVVVAPTAGLRPTVQLLDASDNIVGAATATSAGTTALLQLTAGDTATGGNYRIVVSDAGTATGAYTVSVTLNEALETESVSPSTTNDSLATAQPLDGSFIALNAAGTAKRAAVDGGNPAGSALLATDFESGAAGYVINNNVRGTGTSAGLWHLSTRHGTQAGHSATTSFYYGSESTGTYDTGAANAGTITSPPIAVSGTGPVTLSFNYILVNEGPAWDVASVLISSDGGTTFTTIASSTNTAQIPQSTTWRNASFDVSSYVGKTVLLRFSFDTLDSIINSFEGFYVDDVQINTVGPWNDFYSVNLNAGDRISINEKNTTGAVSGIALLNSAGAAIATGTAAGGNVDLTVAPTLINSAGTYFIRITGQPAATYTLVVTTNAAFDVGANTSSTNPLDITPLQGALGAIPQSGSNGSWYAIDVPSTVGGISLQTSTPADGIGEFTNLLNPHVEFIDPAGNVVATGTNLADGRNESIVYPTPNSGRYVVHISAESNTAGEYFLSTAPLILGDLDRDGQVTPSDLGELLTALVDLNSYEATKGVADAVFRSVADVDRDGSVTNRDIQALINVIISAGAGANAPANAGLVGKQPPMSDPTTLTGMQIQSAASQQSAPDVENTSSANSNLLRMVASAIHSSGVHLRQGTTLATNPGGARFWSGASTGDVPNKARNQIIIASVASGDSSELFLKHEADLWSVNADCTDFLLSSSDELLVLKV